MSTYSCKMNISETKIAAIALARADGVGPSTAQKLLDQFGSAINVFKADDHSLIAMGSSKEANSKLARPSELESSSQ